jgi:hypothetical protein
MTAMETVGLYIYEELRVNFAIQGERQAHHSSPPIPAPIRKFVSVWHPLKYGMM